MAIKDKPMANPEIAAIEPSINKTAKTIIKINATTSNKME